MTEETDLPEWFWLAHRVTYKETDMMGVVYYAHYLHWFEMGRTEFIRARGMSYRLIEADGLFLPVREAGCRYLKPIQYDDLVYIGTRVGETSRTTVTFDYEIRNEDKSLILARGFSQLAAVDKNGRPVRLSDRLKELMGVV